MPILISNIRDSITAQVPITLQQRSVPCPACSNGQLKSSMHRCGVCHGRLNIPSFPVLIKCVRHNPNAFCGCTHGFLADYTEGVATLSVAITTRDERLLTLAIEVLSKAESETTTRPLRDSDRLLKSRLRIAESTLNEIKVESEVKVTIQEITRAIQVKDRHHITVALRSLESLIYNVDDAHLRGQARSWIDSGKSALLEIEMDEAIHALNTAMSSRNLELVKRNLCSLDTLSQKCDNRLRTRADDYLKAGKAVEYELVAEEAIATLSVVMSVSSPDSHAVWAAVRKLQEVYNGCSSSLLKHTVEGHIATGSSLLDKLRTEWVATHTVEQSRSNSELSSVLLKAKTEFLVDPAVKYDNSKLKSFMYLLTNTLHSASKAYAATFVPDEGRLPNAELSGLISDVEAAKAEISWRDNALSWSRLAATRAKEVLESDTDSSREHSRDSLAKAITTITKHYNKRPSSNSPGTAELVDTLFASMNDAKVILAEVDRTHELDMEYRLTHRPVWKPDESSQCCAICLSKFRALYRRRHHCRQCGELVCGKCSKGRKPIPKFAIDDSVRVCLPCFPNNNVTPMSFPTEIFSVLQNMQ